MTRSSMELLWDPDRLRVALNPIRRKLLRRLREPASATHLANELGWTRQTINYHLRALEAAGLVELVEERQRRGFVERIFAAKGEFVVDPEVMRSESAESSTRDQFSPELLVEVAARVVGDVAAGEARAGKKGSRLVTLAIEAEVSLAGPSDVGHFTAALANMLAGAVREFDAPTIGQKYRVVVGGYPAPEDG